MRELVGVLGALSMSAALLGSAGCSPDTVEDPQAGTTTSPSTTSPSTTDDTDATLTITDTGETTMSTFTDTDDSTDPQTNTSGGFYAGPETDIGGVGECDPIAQDCPEGEKCVPYASSGGSWDANKCVPVMGDGQPGEPCTYTGPVVAIDDCGLDSYCWNVTEVEGVEVGTCMLFCAGTYDDPLCDPGTGCLISNNESIALCLELCDPLAQACPEGQGCYWFNNDFFCIFTAQSSGAVGEPCDLINDCVQGAWCSPAEVLPGCESANCCTPFCDVLDPQACDELPELECAAFFEEPAPEGFENLGVCIAPQP